ncbi:MULTISPECIES: hypothetical protein [unclassified Rhodococcus (in: high G+C Gram-positive bacteria)]|nr:MULTISPECIES: hypothetical protein [unclassified Rhodococcus (in: high G+C Gram-positive bacteria)]MBC2644573.1 hypothetical protein [Rhodococcus sp. 3A]MBC2897738.1 hypothetical protein [Rhodococcus sp. 4CII]
MNTASTVRTSPLTARPHHVGGSMSPAEIKSRIEAMFADRRPAAPTGALR